MKIFIFRKKHRFVSEKNYPSLIYGAKLNEFFLKFKKYFITVFSEVSSFNERKIFVKIFYKIMHDFTLLKVQNFKSIKRIIFCENSQLTANFHGAIMTTI